jgi:hypothetical protein
MTIGVGFSSAGSAFEKVLNAAIADVPGLAEAARAVGLALTGSRMSIVDPDKGWIVEAFAAAHYMQACRPLIAFLANCILGVTPLAGKKADAASVGKMRQAFYDAQWTTLLDLALSGVEPKHLAWPFLQLALAVHCKHGYPGPFNWPVLERLYSPDLEEMIRNIYRYLREKRLLGLFGVANGGAYAAIAKKVKTEETAHPTTSSAITDADKTAAAAPTTFDKGVLRFVKLDVLNDNSILTAKWSLTAVVNGMPLTLLNEAEVKSGNTVDLPSTMSVELPEGPAQFVVIGVGGTDRWGRAVGSVGMPLYRGFVGQLPLVGSLGLYMLWIDLAKA